MNLLIIISRLRQSMLDCNTIILPIMTVVLLTLPKYGYTNMQFVTAPQDATVNVGSTTNLTCIVAESYDGTNKGLHWIISWDATASVQRIQANKTQEITGYHYGKEAERGDYYVKYENKTLSTPGSDCTHVIHISVLHIKNATLRDAGTYSCADEWQKATVTVVDALDNLDGCDLVIIIIGLTCVVGWCLAIVEFGVLICMCLQKPKHAKRRRQIARRVSVLLPQSRRAAYNVRMSKHRAENHGYADDDMVQHVPRMVEIEPEEKENMAPKTTRKVYVDITDTNKNHKIDPNNAREKSRRQLVTFEPGIDSTSRQYRKRDKKVHQKSGATKKMRPDSLAIVKPFDTNQSQKSNPVFDGEIDEGDMYVNYPKAQKAQRDLKNNEFNEDSADEIVSTPL